MSRLGDCYNVADFARAAQRRLPAPLFDYIEGGADDEATLAANTSAFERYTLRPRMMRDIRAVEMRRTVLGCELDWPLILAPTGMTRMFHTAGELGVATEAAASGAMYSLSTMATASIEAVARASAGPKLFQLYLFADDARNMEIIDRAKAAGFDALCVTVDTIVPGNRERDLRSGLTVPPRLNAASLLDFVRRPGWCLSYATGGHFSLPNISSPGSSSNLSTLAAYFAANMESNISWKRLEQLARHWGKPFAIKGLQTAEDTLIAASIGVSAVIISNHGGRQLDSSSATIDLVADIADSAGDAVEIILDGGFRRGSHIVKALALGARACMTGRPYLYAVSAFGQPGVARLLTLLRAETVRTLALLGCASINDLCREHVQIAAALPAFLTKPQSLELSA
jgi:L-lactate dehydrogenase (cytochrome)